MDRYYMNIIKHYDFQFKKLSLLFEVSTRMSTYKELLIGYIIVLFREAFNSYEPMCIHTSKK